MKDLLRRMKMFVNDEQGLETVEYAIILGLIVAGTMTLVISLGDWVRGRFQATMDLLPEAATE